MLYNRNNKKHLFEYFFEKTAKLILWTDERQHQKELESAA